MRNDQLCIGILSITPEGGAKAYRDLTLGYYQKLGDYKNPSIVMLTQPLIDHVNSFGDRGSWIPLIQDGINKLERIGATLIFMPANSSHLVLKDLVTTKSRVVDMVDISIQSILKSNCKNSLLIGTSVSMSDSLYFKEGTLSSKCIKPSKEEQDSIDSIILKELILGKISHDSKSFIENLVSSYQSSHDIDQVFFACTELPCFFTGLISGLKTANSISVTVDEIVNNYR